MELESMRKQLSFLGLMGQLVFHNSLLYSLCHNKFQIVQKPKHKI